MKYLKTVSTFLALLSFLTSCKEVEKSNLTLLSNQIPTNSPLVFGSGVISIDLHLTASITFNPDMNELFFQRRKPEESHNIYTMQLKDGNWSKPELAFFSTNKEYLDVHPRFSPKGDRLYFGSTRPLNDTVKSSGLHQWYIEKNTNGWGEPILLQQPFIDRFIMCITPAKNGNLYFNSKEKRGKVEDEGIYYAIHQEGHYATVERMGKKINYPDKSIAAHPYIAPDESYIIYDAERTSEYENDDLYISFNKNGNWTESYNLGPEINTKLSEGAATVSPDGKYLFFSRSVEKVREDGSKYWTGNLYWADFIQLKKELMENINSN